MVASTWCSFRGVWKGSAEHVTKLTPFIGMGHGGNPQRTVRLMLGTPHVMLWKKRSPTISVLVTTRLDMLTVLGVKTLPGSKTVP